MRLLTLSLLAALSTLAAPAHADLGTLKKTCAACHQLDTPLVGPPWQAIAARYQNQADAEQRLAASIRQGSQGQWGKSAAMPPAAHISEVDSRKLARWVLQR